MEYIQDLIDFINKLEYSIRVSNILTYYVEDLKKRYKETKDIKMVNYYNIVREKGTKLVSEDLKQMGVQFDTNNDCSSCKDNPKVVIRKG